MIYRKRNISLRAQFNHIKKKDVKKIIFDIQYVNIATLIGLHQTLYASIDESEANNSR